MNIIDKLLKNVIVNEKQGYACFFYDGFTSYEKINGEKVINSNDFIDFNTNFRLASVSKQFIAYSIVNLINCKLLEYTTPIKKIFNELPVYFNNITILNLLNHTSGIYDYEDIIHNDDDPQIKDIDILDFLQLTDGTYFKPGTKYRYSNTAYILLGLIIEKITNETISNYINKNIFVKANMNNSYVNIEGFTKINNRAYGHLLDENQNLYMKDQYWCSATIGDGGLYSSINDLKKWCLFLSKSKCFEEMKKPNYIDENEYNEYGKGIRIIKHNKNEIYYHAGDTIGTNTFLLFSVDLNICLIFLTNLGNINTDKIKENLLNMLN